MKIKKLLALILSLILVMTALPCPVGVSAATLNIQSDAVFYDGHYYKIFDINTTWESAKSYCENLGGHLVSITSAKEQNFLYNMVNGYFKRDYLYIGISDVENEGAWKWVTGETFSYSNWAKGQPDNSIVGGIENQNYGVIKCGNSDRYCSLGQWDDTAMLDGFTGELAQNRGFICEWDSETAPIKQQISNIEFGPYALQGATISILGYDIPLIDI